MKALSADENLLKLKFDQLSAKYGEWTCANRSKVEDWISRQAKRHMPSNRLLDLCCGVGLMTHLVRLLRFACFLS